MFQMGEGEYLALPHPMDVENPLWQRFVAEAPVILRFAGQKTPLVFDLAEYPDPYPLRPGACRTGRVLSPQPVPRR
ncbi:hypothetical protein ACFFP0_09420 [Rhizobium puerariae]|uniref:Uncharacterized protein n=1 Tax=Rhizobium puerariae TaxID=1585791 RepID=A0ABV6AEL8_9HYPH